MHQLPIKSYLQIFLVKTTERTAHTKNLLIIKLYFRFLEVHPNNGEPAYFFEKKILQSDKLV